MYRRLHLHTYIHGSHPSVSTRDDFIKRAQFVVLIFVVCSSRWRADGLAFHLQCHSRAIQPAYQHRSVSVCSALFVHKLRCAVLIRTYLEPLARKARACLQAQVTNVRLYVRTSWQLSFFRLCVFMSSFVVH